MHKYIVPPLIELWNWFKYAVLTQNGNRSSLKKKYFTWISFLLLLFFKLIVTKDDFHNIFLSRFRSIDIVWKPGRFPPQITSEVALPWNIFASLISSCTNPKQYKNVSKTNKSRNNPVFIAQWLFWVHDAVNQIIAHPESNANGSANVGLLHVRQWMQQYQVEVAAFSYR